MLEETYLDTVAPFRAWRYSAQAGDLGSLIAPPYDVVDPGLQSALYERSPYNVIRVDLGLSGPDDPDSDNRYTRAADALAAWKRSGALVRDPEPSLTFVEEAFTGPDGKAGRRHGVLAVLRLSEFGEGVVFPHEHTLTGPKEDRFRLMEATAMSLSPVFMLYDLPGDDITEAWRSLLGDAPPSATVVDDRANTTRLWPTSHPQLRRLVAEKLAGARLLIADGHHRYETALRYREAHRQASDGAAVESPPACDYCLVYLANKSDPSLAIYPTHRLLSGLADEVVADLPKALAGTFKVERLLAASGGAAPDAPAAQAAISSYLAEHPRAAFGLWGTGLDAPYGFSLSDLTRAHVSPGHSAAYQELDVAILQDLVLKRALGISAAEIAAEQHIAYAKDTAEAFARLRSGESQLGFFMNATGLDQVCEVAFGGERMPQKTTFFYPKLPTGLLFHDLTGSL